MKIFLLWFVLFFTLISTIVFLLVIRSGVTNPFVSNTVTTVATTSTPLSFDQATVYTCDEGSIIALAYKTADTKIIEVSLPTLDPLIMEGANGQYRHHNGYLVSENASLIQVEKDGEIIYTQCTKGAMAMPEPVATTSTPFTFAGSSWQWNVTNSSDGTILNRPNKPADFILKFQDESQFSVSTDCNNAGGSYSTDGKGVVTFSKIIMTLMACDGETKEADFLNTLGQVQSFGFAMTDDYLELRLGEGFPHTYMNFTRID